VLGLALESALALALESAQAFAPVFLAHYKATDSAEATSR
jgi:hypothetical protein